MIKRKLKDEIDGLKKKISITKEPTLWEKIDRYEKILESKTFSDYITALKKGNKQKADEILEAVPINDRKHYKKLNDMELYLEGLGIS